jgi:hypothetical protein
MKTRLLLAVVGLAIGSALPTFAQQTNKPDAQLRQKLVDAIKNIPMHSTRTMQLPLRPTSRKTGF